MLQLLLTAGTAVVSYFRDATMETNPVAKQLYDKLVVPHPAKAIADVDFEELGDMLEQDPKLVLFGDSVVTPTLMSGYPCTIVPSKTEYYKVSNIRKPVALCNKCVCCVRELYFNQS
jgi:hypothetical protein